MAGRLGPSWIEADHYCDWRFYGSPCSRRWAGPGQKADEAMRPLTKNGRNAKAGLPTADQPPILFDIDCRIAYVESEFGWATFI
jgi:hypothetical protein